MLVPSGVDADLLEWTLDLTSTCEFYADFKAEYPDREPTLEVDSLAAYPNIAAYSDCAYGLSCLQGMSSEQAYSLQDCAYDLIASFVGIDGHVFAQLEREARRWPKDAFRNMGSGGSL